MTEIYISVDIETDGDCPGLSSMLSLGAVVISPNPPGHAALYSVGDTFYKTFKRLPEARPSNATMEWWDNFPKQWEETRRNPVDPAEGMKDFEDWVVSAMRALEAEDVRDPKPIFLAGPIGFDFTFVYYYMHRFLGRSIFGHNGVDMRSLAMGILDQPYLAKKERHPIEWATKLPHTHNALEDAMEQADRFIKMMEWRKKDAP